MAYAEKILPHYSYEDYVQWEGKWELIEGFPIAMSPAPSPKHQWVSNNLGSELRIAVRKSGCNKCRVYLPIDYKVAEDTVLQPDLLIVGGEIDKKYLDKAPVLVVEILSPATTLRDRHTKFQIYQQQGVQYYLLVNTDTETVEVFRNSADGFQSVVPGSDGTISLELEEDCSIALSPGAIWQ